MIFYWLVLFARRVRWLFAMPSASEVSCVDPNAKCPACGATAGKLEAVTVGEGTRASVVVEHACSVCGAKYFEKTVLEVGPDKIHTARRVTTTATVTRMAA